MKKCLKIIAVVLILMTCLSGCANLNIKDWAVKRQAINYLCEKSDAESEEFKLVDYRRAHISFEEFMYFFEKPVITDYAFEFEYNGKSFFVNKIEDGFYDDYQLEDIELWCTEWLKENIDSRITGLGLWTSDILVYYNVLGYEYSKAFCQEDAEAIIKCYENEDVIGRDLWVYFYEEGLSDDEVFTVKEQLQTEIHETCMNGNENCFVFYAESIDYHTKKLYDYQWRRYIDN